MSSQWRIFEFTKKDFRGSCSAALCCSVSKTESGLELLNFVHVVAHVNAFLSANKKSFMAPEGVTESLEFFSHEALHSFALLIIVRL